MNIHHFCHMTLGRQRVWLTKFPAVTVTSGCRKGRVTLPKNLECYGMTSDYYHSAPVHRSLI